MSRNHFCDVRRVKERHHAELNDSLHLQICHVRLDAMWEMRNNLLVIVGSGYVFYNSDEYDRDIRFILPGQHFPEDTDKTYSPVFLMSNVDFLEDLIIVGKHDKIYKDNDQSDPVKKHDSGLASISLEKDELSFQRDFAQWAAAYSIPIDKRDIVDVHSSKHTWMPITYKGLPDYNINNVTLHRQCWEIFCSVSKTEYGSDLTLLVYYKQRNELYQHGIVPGTRFQKDMGSRLGLRVGVADWNSGVKEMFKTAFMQSCRSGVIDEGVRDELWIEIKGASFFSPNQFPVNRAFLEDRPVSTVFNTSNEGENNGMENTHLARLPLEILEMIALATNHSKSALHFASTCKTLYNQIAPSLDKVALDEIKKDHPWMMPITPSEERIWSSLLKQVDHAKSKNSDFPWLKYMKICLQPTCWAMVYRQRIF